MTIENESQRADSAPTLGVRERVLRVCSRFPGGKLWWVELTMGFGVLIVLLLSCTAVGDSGGASLLQSAPKSRLESSRASPRASASSTAPPSRTTRSDVVVYGANAAGALSAIAIARRGRRVSLLCQAWPDCWAPIRRIGGLTTGGLGTTDSCHQSAHQPFDLCQLAITGGLAAEFYARSAANYGCRNCNSTCGCEGCNLTLSGPQMPYNVEPNVAHSTLSGMVADEAPRLRVFFEAQVAKVEKQGSQITLLETDDGRQFAAAVFVDSSYEGDLYAKAGVEYTVGREPPSKYNETLAGRLHGDVRNQHEFHAVVDPFDGEGKPLPGLLSEADAAAVSGRVGDGDSLVQAYNYRLCVTNDPSNRRPFAKPAEYYPEDWELLARTYKVQPFGPGGAAAPRPSCNTQPIPNFKFDHNNCGPISSDLITAEYTNVSWRNLTSWAYPEADYETRREIWRVHQTYQQGLLWFLSNDERLPAAQRAVMAEWGLCADEFPESDGWPPALYVREVRRMVGERVLTQKDVREGKGSDIGVSSIGLAAHAEDSHNMQRFICRDKGSPPCFGDGPKGASGKPFAWNEGDFHGVEDAHVYQLPHYLALPQEHQASNLLVVSAPSASHIAFSTFRMEPAFMVMGDSVGVWAALSVPHGGAVRNVSLTDLNAALVEDKQVLKVPDKISGVVPDGPNCKGGEPQPPAPAGGPTYSCEPFDPPRCVELQHCRGDCHANASCSSACAPLGEREWLANDSPNGGFSLARRGGSTFLKAVSSKSFLKKSELFSGELPVSKKLRVAQGDEFEIEEQSPVADANGYWLVTCKTHGCTSAGAGVATEGKEPRDLSHLRFMSVWDPCWPGPWHEIVDRPGLWGPSTVAQKVSENARLGHTSLFPAGPDCTDDVLWSMSGWTNLLFGPTAAWNLKMLPLMAELHARYGYVSMPDLSGFLKGLNATECADFGGCGPVFARSKTGLAPGWNDTIARIAAAVRPYVESGSVAGMMIGDEIATTAGYPCSALEAVATQLRASLPEGLIYTNEANGWPCKTIPPAFDLISYDQYNGDGRLEAKKNRQIAEAEVYPKMHPHQKLLLTPGLFTTDPVHCMKYKTPGCEGEMTDDQTQVWIKLMMYWEWAQNDTRVAGLKPWHYANYAEGDNVLDVQSVGANALPRVNSLLQHIGRIILNGSTAQRSLARQKHDDDARDGGQGTPPPQNYINSSWRSAELAQPPTEVYFNEQDSPYFDCFRIPALLVIPWRLLTNQTLREDVVLAFAEANTGHLGDHHLGPQGGWGRPWCGDTDPHVRYDIVVKRSMDSGSSWPKTPTAIVATNRNSSVKNWVGYTVPLLDAAAAQPGTLPTVLVVFCNSNNWVMVARSHDIGSSWSPPQNITAMVRPPGWWTHVNSFWTGQGGGIQLRAGARAGRLLVPAFAAGAGTAAALDKVNSTGQDVPWAKAVRQHALYSDTGGRSWKVSEAMPPTPGCLANWGKNWTQCADESKLTELSDGRLAMVIRHWAHPVLSISDTHGETWLAPVSITSIDMPECQSSIRQMVNALLLLGPHNRPDGNRCNLTLWRNTGGELSSGGAWEQLLLIESGAAGYTDTQMLSSGELIVFYEGPFDYHASKGDMSVARIRPGKTDDAEDYRGPSPLLRDRLPKGHLKYMTWYSDCMGQFLQDDGGEHNDSANSSLTGTLYPAGPACSLNFFATQSVWNNVITGATSWSLSMLPAIAKLNRLYPKYVGLADVTHFDDNSDGLKGYPAVNCSSWTPSGTCRFCGGDGVPHGALAPEWETVVEKLASIYQPYLKNGSLLGLFIGDELVGSGDWQEESMHKVANKLRELVGPLPEIYTNEDDNIDAWDVVPKGLSMLSYDDYDNHNNNGSVELSRQWEYTHDVMLSRMWPHQRLMLVPGVFGNDPSHCLLHDNVTCPLDKQQDQILGKIKGYIAWSKADVSVAGWKGWHFASYGESDGVTFMQTLGATLFPAVMDVLIGLGRYIVNDDAGPDPPPPPYAAATPLAGPSDPLLKPYVSAIGGTKSLVAMTAKYPTLLHAHEATNQYLLGDDVIVVDAAAAESPNHKVWLPPGGWIEMNNERARMTFSGGLHKECPPDTVDFPNASRFFGYCQNKQYTAFAPSTNFTGRHACGEKTCAQQMYVREGSVIPTALDASSGVHAGAKDAQQDQIIAVKVYPGLCPGVAWRATQFGGPRVINCQNQTAIGGGTECPQYGRFPCEGVVVNQGAKGQINATQVRRYDEDSETMALSVALKRLQGECATCGKFVLHFMHTSPPAVLNCSLERQPNGDPWKDRTTIPQLSPPPSNGSAPESGGWWLGREGPWYVVAVQPPLTLKELSAPAGAARVTVFMW